MPQPSPSELSEMVSAGIISSETASSITSFYESRRNSGTNRFTLVLGVFGALLVGLGIILLVAHNWDNLRKTTKTIFAFLPLLLAQLLCLYVLVKKRGSEIWSEGSAVFLFFSIAAAIALISQIYHVGGSLSGFLLTWLLLSVGLIYIMPSSAVALLYIISATWYATEVQTSGFFGSRYTHFPVYYALLMVLVLPHYYLLWKNRPHSNFLVLHNWAVCISLPIVLGTLINSSYNFPDWGMIGFFALFCIYYIIGTSSPVAEKKIIANPFVSIGMLGVAVILMIWTSEWTWIEFLEDRRSMNGFFNWTFNWICLFLLGLYVALLLRHQIQRGFKRPGPVEYSALIFTIAVIALRNVTAGGALLMNALVLVIGLFFVRGGSKENHLGILNFGLLIIAVLAVLRFFDDGIPFVWRGLFFLIAGAAFFAANYSILKKRKALSKNNPL